MTAPGTGSRKVLPSVKFGLRANESYGTEATMFGIRSKFRVAASLRIAMEMVEEGLISVEREAWFTRARHHAAALGVALTASLVNPNGFALLAHVGGFFGNSAILAGTQAPGTASGRRT